ncbi:hypothetical protein [Allomesorhizobium camelthorni]|uniref:Uncharacterized protein n=1 Tax=Allomesorhizobium camelthorni TaxID=475069 RepID=A0A6G4WBW3_9HYPH|nr:hypothetical protein [Mesorhizobium camelthorni]NGO51630.1 hypothetical protein [Mesorhizobium camelthorni]
MVESTGDDADDKKFNETLKRMLKTPPKPHEKRGLTKDDPKQKPVGIRKDHKI